MKTMTLNHSNIPQPFSQFESFVNKSFPYVLHSHQVWGIVDRIDSDFDRL